MSPTIAPSDMPSSLPSISPTFMDISNFRMCQGDVEISDDFDDITVEFTYELTTDPAGTVGLDLVSTIEDILFEGVHDTFCPLRTISRRHLQVEMGALSALPADVDSGVSCGDNCSIINGSYTIRVFSASEHSEEDLVNKRCENLFVIQTLLDDGSLNEIPGVESTSFVGDPTNACTVDDIQRVQNDFSYEFYIAAGGGILAALGAGYLLHRRRSSSDDDKDFDIVTSLDSTAGRTNTLGGSQVLPSLAQQPQDYESVSGSSLYVPSPHYSEDSIKRERFPSDLSFI